MLKSTKCIDWIRVYHKGVEAGEVSIVDSGYVTATAIISVYANCYVYLYYNINSICNSFYSNTLYPPPTYAVYKTDPKDAPTSTHNSASVYSAKYAAI